MKQFQFFLLFFLGASLFQSVFAQQWPQTGMQWNYCIDWFPWQVTNQSKYTCTGDTLINSQIYYVVQKQVAPMVEPNHQIYLRQSGDTIFRNVNESDYIFFINGLVVGDSFTTFRTEMFDFHTHVCTDEMMLLQVTEIEDVEIGGEIYREVTLADVNYFDVVYFSSEFDTAPPTYSFIEHMGPKNNFAYTPYVALSYDGTNCGEVIDAENSEKLYEFRTINDTIIHFECLETSTSNINPVNAVIFPNPATEHFQISAPGVHGAMVYVHDLSGRTLYKNIMNGESLHIPTSGFAPGVYLVYLRMEQTVVTKKVVVVKP